MHLIQKSTGVMFSRPLVIWIELERRNQLLGEIFPRQSSTGYFDARQYRSAIWLQRGVSRFEYLPWNVARFGKDRI